MTPEQLKVKETQEKRESLADARKMAVAALRTNPQGFKQTTGSLGYGYENAGSDRRCADGLLCDAFHIPFSGRPDKIDGRRNSAYSDLSDLIGEGWPDLVVDLNDTHRKTFREIGDWLAEQWGI